MALYNTNIEKALAKGNNEVNKAVAKTVKEMLRLQNVSLKLYTEIETDTYSGKLLHTLVEGEFCYKERGRESGLKTFTIIDGKEVVFDHGEGVKEEYKLVGRENIITANSVLSKSQKYVVPRRVLVAVEAVLKELPLKEVKLLVLRQRYGMQVSFTSLVNYSSIPSEVSVYIEDEVGPKRVTLTVAHKTRSYKDTYSEEDVVDAKVLMKLVLADICAKETKQQKFEVAH